MVRALDLKLTVMSSNPCNMVIFRFFKMAAAVILYFKLIKFLTVGTVKRVRLHHCQISSKSLEPRPRYVSFNIMLVWLENVYSRPFWVFLGTFPSNDVTHRPNPQKGPSLG